MKEKRSGGGKGVVTFGRAVKKKVRKGRYTKKKREK